MHCRWSARTVPRIENAARGCDVTACWQNKRTSPTGKLAADGIKDKKQTIKGAHVGIHILSEGFGSSTVRVVLVACMMSAQQH